MSTVRPHSVSRWPRVLACLFGLALAMPSLALGEPNLDDRVLEIAAQFRCPVCQNLSVADSPSELAQEMRGVIREQLQAGRTPEQIKAYFTSKYGDWILLSPRPRGLNLLVWLGPFAAAGLGLAVAIRTARRWARRPKRPERPVAEPALLERVRRDVAGEDGGVGRVDPESLSPLELERNRLYDALREVDFDYRTGKLSTADYEAMREEYEARAAGVLVELDRSAETVPALSNEDSVPARKVERTPVRRRPWRLVAGGAFLVVFGLSLGYFLTTSLRPRAGEQDTLTGDFLTGTGPGGIAPGSRGSARDLETRLASGRQAYEQQNWRAAIDAFEQALALDRENPEAHTFLGLILLRAGHVDHALLALDRALARDRNYPFGLWAKGLALFEGKRDYAGAIRAWETLMTQPLSEIDADRVAQMLTEARKRLAAQGRPRGAPAQLAGTITGTVTLPPSLRAGATTEGALFIIARRGDGPPLTVKRIPNPTFPVAFSLGPGDRMLQGTSLEGDVTLIARLKRDGAAGPARPGDLEGRPERNPVTVGASDVRIVLHPAR